MQKFVISHSIYRMICSTGQENSGIIKNRENSLIFLHNNKERGNRVESLEKIFSKFKYWKICIGTKQDSSETSCLSESWF